MQYCEVRFGVRCGEAAGLTNWLLERMEGNVRTKQPHLYFSFVPCRQLLVLLFSIACENVTVQ